MEINRWRSTVWSAGPRTRPAARPGGAAGRRAAAWQEPTGTLASCDLDDTQPRPPVQDRLSGPAVVERIRRPLGLRRPGPPASPAFKVLAGPHAIRTFADPSHERLFVEKGSCFFVFKK